MTITKQFIVKGKVQGVFFRSSVRKKAIELGLAGYAKNLGNGDVEVVAQGKKESIEALKDFMSSHPGASRIEKLFEKNIESEMFSECDILPALKCGASCEV